MEKINKLLIGIIVLLVLLNLTVLGMVSYKNNSIFQNKKQVVVPTNHLGRFFREELALSNEQHIAFQKSRQHYHKNSDILLEKMGDNRNDLLTELGKAKSDTNKLNTLSKNIGNQHTELKNLTIRYYLDMKEVCNEKQRVKLFQLFKKMVNTDQNITMPEEKNYKNN